MTEESNELAGKTKEGPYVLTDDQETIVQIGRDSIQIYKGRPHKRCVMRNENNEVQTDRNEVLRICTCFYTILYSCTRQNQHPLPKNTSPDSSEVPPTMTSKSEKKNLKEMKNDEVPSNDNLKSDVMKLGGEELAKQITKTFNQILETKKCQSNEKRD